MNINKTLALITFIIFSSALSSAHAEKADYGKLYDKVTTQEKTLVFNQFTNDDAMSLGMQMVKDAQKDNLAITIDIARNGQQLFHYALPGTARENDIWVQRKNEVTNRSYQSSLKMWYWQEQGWMEELFHMNYIEMWGLNTEKAMNLGGAFPLTVKNVGTIGTITVSGLPHEKDHDFIVKSLEKYLNVKVPN